MRLLFLIDHLYLHGGAEKVLTERCTYMADVLGLDVTILTTEQQGRAVCYPLSPKVKLIDIGINYHREITYFHPRNLRKIPGHFKKLNAQIKVIRPQVIISLNYAFDFYWLPFIFRKIPKWKEFHGSRYFEMRSRENNRSIGPFLKYKVNDFIESRFDKLILLNPGERGFYPSQNTIVMPNPVVIPSQQAQLNTTTVVSAGRMTYIKGFEYLINAWSIVNRQMPDWQLHIYGDGDPAYREKLVHLVAELALGSVIHIHDATNDLKSVLLDASIYAMASQTECFPMVLLESLALGLPVVSFDCPTGPAHIINNDYNGFLVAANDHAALAQSLLLMMENTLLRQQMGQQAKESAKRFAMATVMAQWVTQLQLQVDTAEQKNTEQRL